MRATPTSKPIASIATASRTYEKCPLLPPSRVSPQRDAATTIPWRNVQQDDRIAHEAPASRIVRVICLAPRPCTAEASKRRAVANYFARAQSERVHLVAGWCDIGNSIRQLRLRHRQRIEGFAQQLDLTSLCHQVPSEQLMERSPRRSSARVRHILGERLFRRLDEDM